MNEYVELLFESSLWSFCCLFRFPDPLSPSSVCQKPKKVSPQSSEDKCGVYLTFQQTVLSIWSSRSFQQTWCQITLQPELIASLCFWARYEHVIRFLRAERLRRLRPDSKIRWMCDAHPPLLGRIQMGFCSVRERQPRQIERGSACPSANSWRVPREAALFFGSCRLIGKLFY